ncbi:uncharacterized protein LOC107619885 [Arachis ipaensis]|nr:uncharacterized protein LOC107619885 [Arachis ipaensis]XP_029152376.1 uncharacterized protein LOC114926096 [Arachis hypogaea]QHN80259.1 WEAK movement UNDER BLUE LIGHT-like protein [Arachis hypogaea]
MKLQIEYEKEIEMLSKELEKSKLEVEAKHEAHMQAMLRLERSQKMTYEMSTLMKKCDTHKNKYIKECMEARARIHELESRAQMELPEEKSNEEQHITISLKEYKSLVEEAKKENSEVGSHLEIALLKKELEDATMKIVELKGECEEALNRVKLVEKEKMALEEKLKRQREHRHRKRAALAALREVSTPQHFGASTSYGTPKVCQPLGKVLNIKSL